MKKYFISVTLILLYYSGIAQKSVSVIYSCSYYGGKNPTTVYTFSADNQANSALYRITEAAGIPKNFKLVAGNVPNACATMVYNPSTNSYDRYIIYNQTFMQKLVNNTNDWTALSILAHEVGHHLSGHSLQSLGSRPDLELEADKFSGFILQKLGATIEETQLAVNLLTQETYSKTHPPKSARLAALANGWYSSYNQVGELNRKKQETISRPNTFRDYYDMPKWFKDSNGELVVEKHGYVYPSNEFKTISYADNNHLFVYSTTEQVSFYCENFKTVSPNLKSQLTIKDCYGDEKDIYVIKTKDDKSFYIIDKGENIPIYDMTWIENGLLLLANGKNGKKYILEGGFDPTSNKQVLIYPSGVPNCINAVR